MRRKVNTQRSSGRIAGSLVASNARIAALYLDHFVGDPEQSGGESETKQFSGLQIDKSSRLHDR
jgi:hypothetical protein